MNSLICANLRIALPMKGDVFTVFQICLPPYTAFIFYVKRKVRRAPAYECARDLLPAFSGVQGRH